MIVGGIVMHPFPKATEVLGSIATCFARRPTI